MLYTDCTGHLISLSQYLCELTFWKNNNKQQSWPTVLLHTETLPSVLQQQLQHPVDVIYLCSCYGIIMCDVNRSSLLPSLPFSFLFPFLFPSLPPLGARRYLRAPRDTLHFLSEGRISCKEPLTFTPPLTDSHKRRMMMFVLHC